MSSFREKNIGGCVAAERIVVPNPQSSANVNIPDHVFVRRAQKSAVQHQLVTRRGFNFLNSDAQIIIANYFLNSCFMQRQNFNFTNCRSRNTAALIIVE
jgi:hypothetical protein